MILTKLAATTLVFFLGQGKSEKPPSFAKDGTMSGQPRPKNLSLEDSKIVTFDVAFRAVGSTQILTEGEFAKIWQALFGISHNNPICGQPKIDRLSDASLIDMDEFLVNIRGFRAEICDPQNWYLAAMRIDPCRNRKHPQNTNKSAIEICSQQGAFHEVRFILQPKILTDREYIFPDASIHLALRVKDIGNLWKKWQKIPRMNRDNIKNFITGIVADKNWNDAAFMIGDGGLARWSFAKMIPVFGQWQLNKLNHGGHFESISDADVSNSLAKTFTSRIDDHLPKVDVKDPLQISSVEGSCIECHLAADGRGFRTFRQFGWDLDGVPIVSERLKREANFTAMELKILSQP